jgi:hypothetical protein
VERKSLLKRATSKNGFPANRQRIHPEIGVKMRPLAEILCPVSFFINRPDKPVFRTQPV